MDMLETIKGCRSVRKYTKQQVSRADLAKIIEAGKAKQNALKNQFAWKDIKNNSSNEEESDIEKLVNKYE